MGMRGQKGLLIIKTEWSECPVKGLEIACYQCRSVWRLYSGSGMASASEAGNSIVMGRHVGWYGSDESIAIKLLLQNCRIRMSLCLSSRIALLYVQFDS